MIKLLIDMLDFLHTSAPLLTSLVILTLLFLLLAKSIKKHPRLYYTLFAIPFVLVALSTVGRMLGMEVNFSRIPFLGEIIRDYIHMGTFGHPLLIIIMYVGALDLHRPNVKRLMSIRKELSIISGFAVFAHSFIRIINNLPNSLKFFTDKEEYLATTKVASELGAGISSFSFVLGVLMLLLFIPLWVTSFGAVRKWMGHVRWKRLQRWSYVLYATLFIHAMGIQMGGMLNPRRGGNTLKATVEVMIPSENISRERPEKSPTVKTEPTAGGEPTVRPAKGIRVPPRSFANIELETQTKRYIHIFSLMLVYGSYLYLRIRKARKRLLTRIIHRGIRKIGCKVLYLN